MIVVMKDGVLHQTGRPQEVYDDPVNLFVAQFLGTPPINTFSGSVRNGHLWIGEDDVMIISGVPDQEVHVGIRPEGFILQEDGPLCCDLIRVEVMGRDTSVVSNHPAAVSLTIRSIISSETQVDTTNPKVRFALKPAKTLLFSKETEERIRFEVK